MRSAQKIVPGGNVINIPLRTLIKELDKNLEFFLLMLFSLLFSNHLFSQQGKRLAWVSHPLVKYVIVSLSSMGMKATHSTYFELFCKANNIITLCTPPPSSHILQPLNVGCFGPLKQSYGRQSENLMRAIL
jgi:hypothetical protein